MFDKELVIDILQNILNSIDLISKRFKPITTSDDFTKDETGLEKLDSICMQLINIGEALKKVDKVTEGNLLAMYPDVDWKKVKGMRDIITHHYFDVDAGIIFSTCSEHTPNLRKIITKILQDLKKD